MKLKTLIKIARNEKDYRYPMLMFIMILCIVVCLASCALLYECLKYGI